MQIQNPVSSNLKATDIINGESYTVSIDGKTQTAVLSFDGRSVYIDPHQPDAEQTPLPSVMTAEQFDREARIIAHEIGQPVQLSKAFAEKISDALYFPHEIIKDIETVNQTVIAWLETGKPSKSQILNLCQVISRRLDDIAEYQAEKLSYDLAQTMEQQGI